MNYLFTPHLYSDQLAVFVGNADTDIGDISQALRSTCYQSGKNTWNGVKSDPFTKKQTKPNPYRTSFSDTF